MPQSSINKSECGRGLPPSRHEKDGPLCRPERRRFQGENMKRSTLYKLYNSWRPNDRSQVSHYGERRVINLECFEFSGCQYIKMKMENLSHIIRFLATWRLRPDKAGRGKASYRFWVPRVYWSLMYYHTLTSRFSEPWSLPRVDGITPRDLPLCHYAHRRARRPPPSLQEI